MLQPAITSPCCSYKVSQCGTVCQDSWKKHTCPVRAIRSWSAGKIHSSTPPSPIMNRELLFLQKSREHSVKDVDGATYKPQMHHLVLMTMDVCYGQSFQSCLFAVKKKRCLYIQSHKSFYFEKPFDPKTLELY